MPKEHQKASIRKMLSEGHAYSKIQKELGVAKSTINHHAKYLKLDNPGRKTFDWSLIQKDIDNGMRVRALQKKHGFCLAAYTRAVRRKAITPRVDERLNMTLDEFCKTINGKRATSHQRRRIRRLMVKEGIPYACSECDLSEWRGKKLSLEVDHIDGDTSHNIKENFRFLCPNCHCVTPTWKGRNCGPRKRKWPLNYGRSKFHYNLDS